MVSGRELCLPCDLLFGTDLDKEQSATDDVMDLVDLLHDTHIYTRQHLKVEMMMARYKRLANSSRFHKGAKVWLYRLTRNRGIFTKLQQSWKSPYKLITRINDVVYRFQLHPWRR